MKTRLVLFGLVGAFVLVAISGCSRSDTVAEGVIYSVEYLNGYGGREGCTRVNSATAVPGFRSSSNVNLHGMLTRDFLIITRPQHPDLGPEIIPNHRLVKVQFGDGGIKTVNENQPK